MKQEQPVPRGWAGVDVGKGHHWVCLNDEAGTTLWSSRVANDEGAILEADRCGPGPRRAGPMGGRRHRDHVGPAAGTAGPRTVSALPTCPGEP